MTNASTTIIFLFIFLSKPNIILVSPATLHSNGTQLTSMGIRDATNWRWGERINKALGDVESTLEDIREKNLHKIEAHVGMAQRLVRDLEIQEDLQDEIKHTLEHNNQSYGEWCDLSDKDKNNNKVKLTVKYDMGWQKRSSGRRYDFSSGHAFIIGARSKGIIRMVLYSKACGKCDAAENRREETEEHEFPKNFEGSSKSMEASAILKMVEDAFYYHFFIIGVIVSDDDSTMRDVLKHPSKGARGQVLKSSKVKLDTEIPKPSFLADPSHHVKVVAKHIFSVVNESRDLL